MSDFAEKKCVSCESGLPPLDYKEIHKYLKKVNGWDVKTNLYRAFFKGGLPILDQSIMR